MKNCKHLIAMFILAVVIVLPVMAQAATFCNVKMTVNGKTQTLQVPIKNSTGCSRFTFTLKNGKWVLVDDANCGKSVKDPKSLTDWLKVRVEKPVTPGRPEQTKPEKPDTNPGKTDGLTADEKKMLDLVNAERQKAGLKPLKADMRLVDISRKKSKDMIENNYFSHTSPTYGSPSNMLKKSGITYRTAGENLAGASDVERAHTNLMNSPGHRSNILNPNYTHIGIGIEKGGPYGKMFTQTFIGIN